MRQQLNDRGYASAGKQRRSTANPLKAISAFANQLGIPPKLTSVRDWLSSWDDLALYAVAHGQQP